MKTYISYGGGVNSTAMAIICDDYDEIVFCDTGAEYPETYEYLDYFQKNYLDKKGKRIVTISAMGMGLEKECLLNYFRKYQLIPSRFIRSCTKHFKIKPLHRYYQKPCVQLIGIDAGEIHRTKPSKSKDIISEFPLVEQGISRRMCMDIIKGVGLCLPRKSGCYFCAFQGISGYRQLYQTHPDLFQKVCDLEMTFHKRYNLKKYPDNPDKWIFIKDKPMKELAHRFHAEVEADELQEDLFDDFQDSMSCMCKFG